MNKKINKEKIVKEEKGKEEEENIRKRYSFKERLNNAWNEHKVKVDLNYVFTFGAHKGKTCRTVCEEYPQYITWCMQKNILDFEKEVIDYCIKAKQKKEKEEQEQYEERRRQRQEEARRRRQEEERREREEAKRRWDDYYRTSDSTWEYFFGRTGRFSNNDTSSVSEVKIVSPAAQWDHLPDKQKYGKILGIEGNRISKEEIRTLYKKRMLEYHPDKSATLGKLIQELSHEMTTRIQNAYEYFQKNYGV